MSKRASGHPSVRKGAWIDISYPLGNNMIYWPTSPIYPHIEPVRHPSKGDKVTMFQLNINAHNGTHVDAPRHFMEDGISIDQMPLGTMIDPARIIKIEDEEAIKPEELLIHDIQPGERILFKTRNSSLYSLGHFVEDYVYITNEAALYLRDKQVLLVGIDYLAIASFKNKENFLEVHKTPLGSGIWVIETLDLSGVAPGMYEMIRLPINITSEDAAPARVIVQPLKREGRI
ncbi:MAG: cyclase family protein [candidate division WOR-3 bacterium]